MNDLGLPPFGREPSFAADEAAYVAVVGAALGRRRARAVAGTSATAALALVAVVALGGTNGTGRASVEPADRLPTATWSPPAHRATAPTAMPTLPAAIASAVPNPFPRPSATARPSEPAPQRPTPSARPTPEPDQEIRPQFRESVSYVKDRPGERCTMLEAADGWCFRYLGPTAGVRSGEAVTFTSEVCRLSTARAAAEVPFESDPEVWVALRRLDGEEKERQAALSFVGFRERHHSRSVPVGDCLRWQSRWTGLDHAGVAMAPGTYELLVVVTGDVPREEMPPARSGKITFFYATKEFAVS